MSFETITQQIVYDELNGALSCNVYDDVPFLPEGASDENFPYVVIGNDTHLPFDNDDHAGTETTLTLHFWSREQGMKEVKALMGEAYTILHRASLTKTGYNVIDCLFEFSESFVDVDGRTRHGVQRYRLTVQEV